MEKRESKSRPDRGVLIISMRLLGGETTLLTLKEVVPRETAHRFGNR